MQQVDKTQAWPVRLFQAWGHGCSQGTLQAGGLGRFYTNTCCVPAFQIKLPFPFEINIHCLGKVRRVASGGKLSGSQNVWQHSLHRTEQQPEWVGRGRLGEKPPSRSGDPCPRAQWLNVAQKWEVPPDDGGSPRVQQTPELGSGFLCSPCTAMAAEGRALGEVHGETLYTRTGSGCAPWEGQQGPGHGEGHTVPDVVPKGLPVLSLPLGPEFILCQNGGSPCGGTP